ncbi:MAG: type I pantothenate kinase [Vicinamibacterales bacterium]
MVTTPEDSALGSRYRVLSRAEWAGLRRTTPLPLSEPQLRPLVGLTERMSLDEVADVYLPLSRLLNLHVAAVRQRHQATDSFLGTSGTPVPFVIGIAGSVAVGKSTTARVLRALMAHWPSHPTVDLVTTDGFLLPQAALASAGLEGRKGFPDSYDVRALLRFLADVKAGEPEVQAPVYSHLRYDIVPNEYQVVRRPDVVIIEGLNVLQTGRAETGKGLFVSDFFDFSIYVDAEEADIEQWYVDRFLALRDTVFTNPASYFHRYAMLSREEAIDTARGIWHSINLVNLQQNVLPTRERAHLVLQKGRDHAVRRVMLRLT